MDFWVIRLSFDILVKDGKRLVVGVRRFQNEDGRKTVYTGKLSPPENPVVQDRSLMEYAKKYAARRNLKIIPCAEKPNVFFFYRK